MVISVKAQINFNNNTINSQNYSSAIGEQNTSTGLSSFASGKLNASEGSYSISLGYGISATGNSSFGAGLYNSLSGGYSIGIGNYLSATQTKSFIIGSGYNYTNPMVNNIANSLMVGFGSTKPTFFVSTATASDKTGKIGIGDITSPGAKLHIKSDYGEEAVILVEPDLWNADGWAEIRVGNGSNAVKGSYTYGLQLKTDKNYLFDSPNAKVGIGTSTPSEKLEVSGNIKTSGTGYMMTSKVQAIDNKGLSLYGTAGTGIIVMNDGKVGIGTNLPGEKLEVNGKVKSASLQVTTGYAAGKLLQSDASGNAVWTDPAWMISGSNVYKTTGNVGIGTNPTTNRLEVAGTVNATNFTGNGAGLYNVPDIAEQNIILNGHWLSGDGGDEGVFVKNDGTVGIMNNNPIAQLDLADIFEAGGMNLKIGNDCYFTDIDISNSLGLYGCNQSNSSASLKLGSNGVTLTGKEGKLGIGTTTPDALLTVAGKVLAQEIEVSVTAGQGADFVFENDHELQDMVSLEEYIKINKHLPGIPSADEMRQNNINVGDFQIKLLEKIEELTLYVIQLKKEISALNENSL
jgi:hypothetical protein